MLITTPLLLFPLEIHLYLRDSIEIFKTDVQLLKYRYYIYFLFFYFFSLHSNSDLTIWHTFYFFKEILSDKLVLLVWIKSFLKYLTFFIKLSKYFHKHPLKLKLFWFAYSMQKHRDSNSCILGLN